MLGVLASRSRSRPDRTGHIRHVEYAPEPRFMPSETNRKPLKHDQEASHHSHYYDKADLMQAFVLSISILPLSPLPDQSWSFSSLSLLLGMISFSTIIRY
jgi:hypothetical protein